jgi:sporulation protein YunB
MAKRRKGRRGAIARIIILWLLIFGCIAAIIKTADNRLRSVVIQLAQTKAKVYSTLAINSCVTEVLAKDDTDYTNLVYIQTNENGLSDVRANITAINTLKAQLTTEIQNRISEYSDGKLYIAIGTLVGSDVFTGRGPKIEVKLVPVGYVTTTISNEFTTAGINQTLHRILMTVTGTVTVVMGGYSATSEVTADFCIAETIIVGAVPQAYTHVTGSGTTDSNINDFMANPDGSNGIGGSGVQ